MEENKIIPASKHEIVNKKRRELAAKCIEDPYDMDSLEALFKLVHPLAAFVMNKHKRRIPSMEVEDYMQLADIVVWRVLNRIRVVPDIMNSFEAYLVASIRNCYITEYRKYVFKSLVEGRSFDRPGDTFSVATLYSMEEYVNRIVKKRNATRRAFRQNNLELVRQREREYWSKNKDKKREKDKRYCEKHKAAIAAKHKEYRATHMAERNARERKYRAEHLEETRAKRREYYWKTVDHQRAYNKQYDDAHRDVVREYQRRYYEKHRDEILAKNREYKRKKRAEKKLRKEQEKE